MVVFNLLAGKETASQPLKLFVTMAIINLRDRKENATVKPAACREVSD